jgi:cysteine-rich repeat protein
MVGNVRQIPLGQEKRAGAGNMNGSNYYQMSGTDVMDFTGDFYCCVAFKGISDTIPSGNAGSLFNDVQYFTNTGWALGFYGPVGFGFANGNGNYLYDYIAQTSPGTSISVGCAGKAGSNTLLKLNNRATRTATNGGSYAPSAGAAPRIGAGNTGSDYYLIHESICSATSPSDALLSSITSGALQKINVPTTTAPKQSFSVPRGVTSVCGSAAADPMYYLDVNGDPVSCTSDAGCTDPGYRTWLQSKGVTNSSCLSITGLPHEAPSCLKNSPLKRFIFTNEKNSDAIGIQIFPNSKHLSPEAWYRLGRSQGGQGFEGKLQTTVLDGYDAVTDGNNVYVSALNYASTTRNLYDVVYLISINAGAKDETRHIFEELLNNFKFNINLTHNDGYCGSSITTPNYTTKCTSDLDCPSPQICVNQVAKLQRNFRRLHDLRTIDETLTNYYLANSSFPSLKEGSFITGQTLSTWPGWASLGTTLSSQLPKDPVNRLPVIGTCSPNAGITCTTDTQCSPNLASNGFGQQGTSYNFPGSVFVSDTHAGVGSFRFNTVNYTSISNEFLPVDINRSYTLQAWGRAGDANGQNFSTAGLQYFGIAPFDIDHLNIYPYHIMKYGGSTDTRLAADLRPGDTMLQVDNATGWYNGPDVSYQRQFVWYGYTNSRGEVYPDYTYTRNFSGNYPVYAVGYPYTNTAQGAWAPGGVVGNTINLRAPWPGPLVPRGTAVRNANSGGTFRYIGASGSRPPNTWTPFTGQINGIDTGGTNNPNQFPYGTAYLKIMFIINHFPSGTTPPPGYSNNMYWSDVVLTDSSFISQNINLQTVGTCTLHDEQTGWSTADRRFSYACAPGSLAYRFFASSSDFSVRTKFEDPGVTISNLTSFVNGFGFTHPSWISGISNWTTAGSGICDSAIEVSTLNKGTCGDGSTNRNNGEECDPPGTTFYDKNNCTRNGGTATVKICDSKCHWGPQTTVSCSSLAKCGNAVVEPGEVCDEGILNGRYNHCNSTCTSVNNPAFNPSNPSASPGYCGDGARNPVYELCDTNRINVSLWALLQNDSCNFDCQSYGPYCGDTITDSPNETCDGGSQNGNVCVPAYGNSCNYCSATCQTTVIPRQHYCGDSTTDTAYEACDRGAQNGQVCTPGYGGSCTYCASDCSLLYTVTGPFCGDNITNGSEGCDDATRGQVCTPAYNSTCSYCASDCSQFITVPRATWCGDGVISGGIEACDDGNTNSNDGCSATCTLEANWTCNTVGGRSLCTANTQTVSCTGLPANAQWNTSSQVNQTWNGTIWQPVNTGSYNTTPGTCRYTCSAGYRWNGLACIPMCQGVICYASDQCHVAGTCDSLTGICSNPIKANGTACNDGNNCTRSDTCTAGICGGTSYTCAAPTGCQASNTCDGLGGCTPTYLPDGSACGGTLAGGYRAGTCSATVCDTTCPFGWSRIGGATPRCMVYRGSGTFATAAADCAAVGGWLPSVAELNSQTCSDVVNMPATDHWSTRVSDPCVSGHCCYHIDQPSSCPSNPSITDPRVTTCSMYSFNSTCGVPYCWIEDTRIYGYRCLKAQTP